MDKRIIKAKLLPVTVAVVCSTLVSDAWACGPNFPNRFFGDDGGSGADADAAGTFELYRIPASSLRFEVDRIITKYGIKAADGLVPMESAKKGTWSNGVGQTTEIDLREVKEALAGTALTAEQQAAALAAYGDVRRAAREFKGRADDLAEKDMPASSQPPFVPPALPQGLPDEFALYIQGAVAYYQADMPAARAAWEKLLALPEAQRRHRGLWAVFMIAKSWLPTDAVTAAAGFERTREAARGDADELHLAAASLGWQARAELVQAHYETAMRLYLEGVKAGDATSYRSVDIVVHFAMKNGPEAVKTLAGVPLLRDLTTAVLLQYSYPGSPASRSPNVATWLAALQDDRAKNVDGAERLAWLAYRHGLMDDAKAWAAVAPKDAWMAQWVQSKLLLRDGKIEDGMNILAALVRDFPPEFAWGGGEWFPDRLTVKPRSKVMGELGALQLTRQDFVNSLDMLVHGAYWLDAAYIAERVLTVPELKDYVDRSWPTAETGLAEDERAAHNGFVFPPGKGSAFALRSLLGRRLVREEQVDEAAKYLPPVYLKALQEYGASLRMARDQTKPVHERVAAFAACARILRNNGLEIMGTETDPDWAAFGGNFKLGPVADSRRAKSKAPLMASETERQRVKASVVKVDKRFHYRYVAAGYAREALALAPPGDPDACQLAQETARSMRRDAAENQHFDRAVRKFCPKG